MSTKFYLIILINLFIVACASGSMEFRSAKTKARIEKDLNQAEEYGLKALKLDVESNNALVPYFLAIEIYRPKEDWMKMSEMLEEALKRNPSQKLENPIILDGSVIQTVSEAVELYREEEWGKLYNKCVDFFQTGDYDSAIENLKIAIAINPNKGQSYGTLAAIYIEQSNLYKAKEIALLGIENSPNYSLCYQVLADISIREGNLAEAENFYETAISKSKSPGPIMRQLVFLYIDKGDITKAIDYSEVLLDKYPNDPDIYFNIGVLFQRLALDLFDPSRELYLKINDGFGGENEIKNVFNDFNISRKYANNARDYFLQASDLEIVEGANSGDAAKEMRKLIKQIDEIFIPSIREIARKSNYDL